MTPMMKLVIGWTIVGGFVFTMIVTCLSLVGWIKFADPRQQQKLFYALIIEVVVLAGAMVLRGARLDVKNVAREVETHGGNLALAGAIKDMLDKAGRGELAVEKAQLEVLADQLQPEVGASKTQAATWNERTNALRSAIRELPEGRVSSDASKKLSTHHVLRAELFAPRR